MNKTEKKIPALRFPEFEGEWVEKRLGEIAERITQKNTELNENVLTISAQEGLINQLKYFNNSVSSKNISGYYLLQKDDFAYNKSYSKGYPMGAIKRLKNYPKGIVSTLYICFRNKKRFTNSFAEQYFESGRHNRELEKVAQEGARNHGLLNIGVSDFFDTLVIFPSLPEQQKIADFLSAVDKRLQSLKDKKTKLEEYKRGVMQRIFSQELRFTRPDGSAYPDWEEKRLGEICEVLRGTSFSKSEIVMDGKTQCIHYGELFTEYKELITSVVSRTNLGEGLFSEQGDVLMPTSDVTPNGLARASALNLGNILLGGDMNIIRIKGNLYYVFLSYFLNFDKQNIIRLVTGTTVKHIYASDIKGLNIPLPCLDEQHQIADFLSSIDDKIALLTKQIESTEQYKKGLLQQLFV